MSQNLVALLDGVRKCKCIRTILMGGNPFTANDITEMLSALQSGATMRGQPKTLDLGRYQWIDQEQRLLLDKAVARNRGQLRIVYAGTMMQRPPEAVDFRWVLMRRMRTLALKPKKAKKRRDMGQFFLALQRELEPRDRTVDEFMGELKAFGAKLDDPLKAQVCAQFKHKSKDQVLHLEMAECYLQHFPTEWIEPIVKAPRPPPKKGKGKEKGKK